jgi:predicted transcriptional regulator
MKILWRDGPQTVRQVKDTLTAQGGDPPAYTTVMTMMKQLAEKGALTVDRDAQTYVYAPAVRRSSVLGQWLGQLLDNVFDGKVEDLVLQLAEDHELSAEDFRRIEARIAAREKEQARTKPRAPKRGGKAR